MTSFRHHSAPANTLWDFEKQVAEHRRSGACSGERAALEAGSGDVVNCYLCERETPGGDMIPFGDGRHSMCPDCAERLDEQRRAELNATFRAIFAH